MEKKEIILKNFKEDIGGQKTYDEVFGQWPANRFRETCVPNFKHFQDPKDADELMKLLIEEKFLRIISSHITLNV